MQGHQNFVPWRKNDLMSFSRSRTSINETPVSKVDNEQLKTGNNLDYYKNIDTVRFFAVFSVIFYHWIHGFEHNGGKYGVDIFFAISGFLITEILLKTKEKLISGKITLGKSFLSFYARRTLRIFPLYYLIVAFVYSLHDPLLKDRFYYVACYMTNFLIDKVGFHPPPYSHLWSLAVEEQFYLFWPMLIFMVGKKYLLPMLLVMLTCSLILLPIPGVTSGVGPIHCFSNLGSGALIAIIKNYKSDYFQKLVKANKYLFPIAFSIALLQELIVNNHFIVPTLATYYISQYVILFFAFTLLIMVLTNKNKTFNHVFQNPVTSYLGKISYGLYIYHEFVPMITRNMAGVEKKFVIPMPVHLPVMNGVPLLLFNLTFLIVLSTISWFFFERPINNLKRYFSY